MSLDPTTITVIVIMIAFALVLVYVLFFMPDMNEEEEALHKRWKEAADKLGLTLFPMGSERLEPYVKGEYEGLKVRFQHQVMEQATKVRNIINDRYVYPPMPTTMFRVTLHPIWPPYIYLLVTRLKGKMRYRAADLEFLTEATSGDVQFHGVPFQAMEAALKSSVVQRSVLRAAETFDEIRIHEHTLTGRIRDTDHPVDTLVRATQELVALGRILSDLAMEHSELRDERYVAPSVAAENRAPSTSDDLW